MREIGEGGSSGPYARMGQDGFSLCAPISAFCLGRCVGALLFISDRFGRKRSVLFYRSSDFTYPYHKKTTMNDNSKR